MRTGKWAPLAAGLMALALAAPVQAAFPGQNGRIAFAGVAPNGSVDVYSAEPDNRALARLTEDGASENPAFSPDGSRLAFTSGTKVYIGDQYANDPQLVLDPGVGAFELDWSPDGTQLVASFPECVNFDCEADIFVFGTDGSGLTNLTNSFRSEQNPSWSPDGTKIAFDATEVGGGQSDVYTMNPDGTGLDNITDDPDMSGPASEPDWSPDGSRIAFQSASGCCFIVWTANSDGSDREFVSGADAQPAWSPDGTQFAYQFRPLDCCEPPSIRVTPPPAGFWGRLGNGHDPDWQVRQPDPVPPPGAGGYARPKGATPLRVPLVLNYDRCPSATATLQHGPPLAYPSCDPEPYGVAHPVTVGTPDSNGHPAESAGFVRFDVEPGDPGTPADEADVRIRVQQTDLRSGFNPAADVTGSLVLHAVLRTTDRWNEDGSGTVVDFPLRAAVPCATTVGPEGSSCALDTTMEALSPGLVRERVRTLWEVGQVQAHWGASSPETLEDNRPLLVQGLFVP